ncbi:MAG: glycine--tRNA ligase [Candidatus Colwellbacteria bacterium]|nr:glycine--tRNA ligase [Candidatus Colwellbacteria bacterium]
MDKIVSLAKRRGFVFPGSEIYGGLQNSWDYGPLGVEMKKNIKDEWWRRFVRGRSDIVGLDAAVIMNPKVWEASGHVANFTDPLVECRGCHRRFRSDHIEGSACPDCGGELMEQKQFNLMLKTFLGSAEEKANAAYLRPETAQAMFVNFKNILDTTRRTLPFGIAQIGKAFRNEITPGNFIFRTREFEQMEIEYFIPAPKSEAEWREQFEMWRREMGAWAERLGIPERMMHEVEIPDGERAHYSKRTIDFEFDFPFGQKELHALAYRTDFDLTNHQAMSGESLGYRDPKTGEACIPHVIEPTWGVDRAFLAALTAAYREEEAPTAEEGESETRVVLALPNWLAPVKVAILPLSKKEELSSIARGVADELRRHYTVEYDETQSIGKRYRRQDEIGTPFCVTIDFDSFADKAATVRDRDTMKQERIPLAALAAHLGERLA